MFLICLAWENALESVQERHRDRIEELIRDLTEQIKSLEEQVRSPEMIDQENQTEFFVKEDPLNTEQFNEYLDEIPSFSSNDLENECKQILSKQNINSSSLTNLNLNQLALITLRSLLKQHFIDEAKQLYNETIIKALKEEYELVNNEKTKPIECESLLLTNKYDFVYFEEIVLILRI